MGISLFPHNQRAYEAAIALLNDKGRAAIVHPTGTGKSYVAFRLIEEKPMARTLWLSPSEHIFKTQMETLRQSDPAFPVDHVQFATYAKLMIMDEADLVELKPEIIVLDEFHRCVAGETTWGEAIDRGILPAPMYVTTVYRYQKDLERYQRRVISLRTKNMLDKNQAILDELRRSLEKADDLEKIFARHITERSGKCIQSGLSSIWEQYYDAASEYAAEHGHLNVQKRYVSPGRLRTTQRKVRVGRQAGILTDEQIAMLGAMGICWTTSYDSQWEAAYRAAEAFYRQNGNSGCPRGVPVPRWCGAGKVGARAEVCA